MNMFSKNFRSTKLTVESMTCAEDCYCSCGTVCQCTTTSNYAGGQYNPEPYSTSVDSNNDTQRELFLVQFDGLAK